MLKLKFFTKLAFYVIGCAAYPNSDYIISTKSSWCKLQIIESVNVNFALSHLLPFTSSDFNNPCQTTNHPNYAHDTEAFKKQTESQLSFSNYKRKLSSWTNIISTLDNLYSWTCILIWTKPARSLIEASCFV